MKYRNIIIFIIGLVFLVGAVFFISDDILSPYVTFKQARSKSGEYVQIIGKLDRSTSVVHSEGSYTFRVSDKEGSKMTVMHQGSKPQNFEHTDQLVMLGRYNKGRDIFVADKVLIKCPSKYRRKQ